MTTQTLAQRPIPGPRAFPLLGKQMSLLHFYRHPFRLLRHLQATYGDVVALVQGDPSFVFAFGPEMNHQLLAQPELFENGTGQLLRLPKNTAAERLFAQNLAVMNGVHHKQQRRLMQPAFHRQQVQSYCADMVALTERTLDRWRPHTSSFMYPGDAFALETFQSWLAMVDAQERPLLRYLVGMLMGARRRRQALWHVPLGTLDVVTTSKHYPFWHDWLAHDRPDDPWWASGDHSGSVAAVTAPNHLVGGWHDFMLPFLLKDYWALVAAGQRPYLTIGPWLHTDAEASMTGFREALIWLRAHLLGDRRGLREAPVRIFVMGANAWRELSGFPPATLGQQRWYLQPGHGFSTSLPPDSAPDRYCFDPSDPTPSVGGAGRFVIQGRGAHDNRAVEARPDVLVYTSEPLEPDTEIIGAVSAELFVRSSSEHTDFFVRLCDVGSSGKSMNVCDGLQRLFPDRPVADAHGCQKVTIELWPTAYRFHLGHRIRMQVTSGSFPRWDRNLGSGESSATAPLDLLLRLFSHIEATFRSFLILFS